MVARALLCGGFRFVGFGVDVGGFVGLDHRHGVEPFLLICISDDRRRSRLASAQSPGVDFAVNESRA